uniref:Protein SHQ1 homolog n=1 Tax=Schistocephalus solidus TaxID=70667 RepID=A0A0X3P0Y7_SCHSO
MLAPLFHLSQSDVHLLIKLHIPLGDLGNSELLVEDGILYFTAPPYYLRLELPGDVLETDDHIQFKLENSDLFVTLTKAEPGQIFKDLDLLSKFIIKPTKTDPSAMKGGIKMLDASVEKEPEEHKYEWFNGLKTSEDEESSFIQLGSYSYGFANSKQGLFTSKEELSLPIDLPDPDHCPPNRRRSLQLNSVRDHFSPEHYIADFCEPEASAAALSAVVPWMCQQKRETDEHPEGALRPPLTDEHRHRLIVLADHRLPLLPPVNSSSADELDRTYLYLGLLDLLLAFTHDFCAREGDENTESAWVIVKLASTLSWLEVRSVSFLKQARLRTVLSLSSCPLQFFFNIASLN